MYAEHVRYAMLCKTRVTMTHTQNASPFSYLLGLFLSLLIAQRGRSGAMPAAPLLDVVRHAARDDGDGVGDEARFPLFIMRRVSAAHAHAFARRTLTHALLACRAMRLRRWMRRCLRLRPPQSPPQRVLLRHLPPSQRACCSPERLRSRLQPRVTCHCCRWRPRRVARRVPPAAEAQEAPTL